MRLKVEHTLQTYLISTALGLGLQKLNKYSMLDVIQSTDTLQKKGIAIENNVATTW